MSDAYAVIGNPIHHSMSPRIHAYFAQQTQQDLTYQALLAPLDGFAATLAQFHQQGGCGVNITVPFKVEAYKLAQKLSQRAQYAQAVNTLIWQADNTLWGDNTDGVGLVRDLVSNLNIKLQGGRVLILGAGGAVRGVLAPLLAAGANLTLHNRTAARALELIKQFAGLGEICLIGAASPADSDTQVHSFDIIINATSASLQQSLPDFDASWIAPHTLCYDMVYANQPTAFMQFAQQAGASRCVDGLGMLIEQAAEAFYLWRQVRPNTTELVCTRLHGLL